MILRQLFHVKMYVTMSNINMFKIGRADFLVTIIGFIILSLKSTGQLYHALSNYFMYKMYVKYHKIKMS